ncbi:MAG: BTAD domain-containing putative transcriptional regulator, partial [Gemmatimonadales bacterium]
MIQPKRLALLLYLTLADPPGPQSRESLMALLWPEADEESTRHSLRNALYGLRQVLGEGAIAARGEGYVELDPTAIRCDAVEVRGLLAAQRWKDALAAWRGDLAPGFHLSGAPEFERWLDEQRAALRRSVADAGWRRVDEMEGTGEPGIGDAARRAWSIDPTNEAGARRLMQVLDATAGRAAALRAYDDLTDYLRREYEAVPSVETRSLAEQLRARQAPPLPAPPDAAPSVIPATPAEATLVAMPAAMPAPARAEVAPSIPRAHPRRRLDRRVLGAIAILVAAAGSVVALRSPRHAASSSAEERPATRLGGLELPARYRADTGAYGSYLRGLSLRFQGHHDEALDTFAALVGRAPQYPPGLAGLAHSYGLAFVA